MEALAAATEPTTASQPTSAPAQAQATGIGPTTLALCAVGLCVLAVWGIRCIARPDRLRLRRTPGRPNRLNIVHMVLVPTLWIVATALTGGACQYFILGETTTQPVEGEIKARIIVIAGAVGAMVWLVASLVVAAATFRHGLRRGFGLSLRRWACDLPRAVIAYLAVLPICVGVSILFAHVFSMLNLSSKIHPLLKYMTELPPPWQTLAVFQAVILVPIAEEVFFRGLLQSFVRQTLGSPVIAVLLASAIFGAVHYTQPQAIPSLFVLALALGYTYERTGRLITPILIHAIFNGVNIALWPG